MKRKADAPAVPSAARRTHNGKAPIAAGRELSIDELITDVEDPVDNIFIEKQRRLLPAALYEGWRGPGRGRTFLAASDVGVFPEKKQTPIAPDVLFSLDVPEGLDFSHRREHRSYFVWIMGKPPDVVFEFVSDRRGGAEGHKKRRYAHIGVPYYVVFDPERWLRGEVLRSYQLGDDGGYHALKKPWFPTVKLGVTLWEGVYEDYRAAWLRWCDAKGKPIPTAAELAGANRRRIEQLKAQLRRHGIEPTP